MTSVVYLTHISVRQLMVRKAILLFVCCWAMSGLAHAEYAGSDTCGACHSDIYESWEVSIHAKAYSNESFQKTWEDNHKNSECLTCHTTGHEAGSAKFAQAGVTCESCHGAMSEGHPDTAKMSIPVSSEMCRKCHEKTYQEWKVSKHHAKNIRCFDCHNVHAQGLRAGGGDALCGSCHQSRLTDFAHSTHHLEGLKCSTCHMPAYAAPHSSIEGTGAAGHTLSVGAEVCSRCHENNVHKSAKLPELREKVTSMNQQMTIAGVDNVFDLNEKTKDLEWRLARAKQGAWVAALLFLMVGLAFGWLGGWYLYGRKRNPNDKPKG